MATSGYIETGANAGRSLVLAWSRVEVGKNSTYPYGYSKIYWELRGGGTNRSEWVNCKNFQCAIAGYHSGLHSETVALHYGQVLLSGHQIIKHNSNGEASFDLGISGYIYYYSANNELTASARHNLDKITVWWDINAMNPERTTQRWFNFNEYVNGTKKNGATKIDNELEGQNYQPYDTLVQVGEIETKNPGYALEGVYKQTGTSFEKLNTDSNGRYGFRISSPNQCIEIRSKYKESTITLKDSNIQLGTIAVQFNQTKGHKATVPDKIGHSFLGWYDSLNRQVYNENGDAVFNSAYWDSNGRYLGYNNIDLFAHWKTENVTYVKDKDGWKLSTVYVKDNDNQWKPAIMYVKTEAGWKQSIVK